MAVSEGAVHGGLFAWLRRDPLPRALLRARITHARFSPKPYVLSHRLTYLKVPLRDLPRLARPFLARNGFSLFALNDCDYGDGKRDLNAWVRAAFEDAGASPPDGAVELVTLPRVAGFGFNPVSFWLCRNRSGALAAVLAEVNNTFGERHCYLCRNADGSVIGADAEIEAQKVFHVSPFMPTDGCYRFRFIEKADRLSIRIDLYREGERALTATIAGHLETLTSAALLKSFVRHPFPTLQVVMLIHYHAARLYMRGIKFFTKPEPPAQLVTASLVTPIPAVPTETT